MHRYAYEFSNYCHIAFNETQEQSVREINNNKFFIITQSAPSWELSHHVLIKIYAHTCNNSWSNILNQWPFFFRIRNPRIHFFFLYASRMSHAPCTCIFDLPISLYFLNLFNFLLPLLWYIYTNQMIYYFDFVDTLYANCRSSCLLFHFTQSFLQFEMRQFENLIKISPSHN